MPLNRRTCSIVAAQAAVGLLFTVPSFGADEPEIPIVNHVTAILTGEIRDVLFPGAQVIVTEQDAEGKPDARLYRAYDTGTAELLWAAELPQMAWEPVEGIALGGTAPMSAVDLRNGVI